MRRALVVAIACSLIAGPLATTTHAGGGTKPVTIGKDPAGDWSAGAGTPGEGAFGDAMAQDLIEAQIGMADAKTILFVIKVNSLPPIGGVPEFTRYTWEMMVGSESIQLDGKFTNYSRGVCDPTAGNCPPPRDPGTAPFAVRTNCGGTGATTCEEIGLVNGSFDAGSGSIEIPVPLKLLGAKSDTKIVAASFFFGGITSMPSAFASLSSGPSDQLFPGKTFVVP